MDNFFFEIQSEGRTDMESALLLAARGKKVIGYRMDKEHGIVLYWAKSDKMIPFPVEMTIGHYYAFLWEYISKGPEGQQPDHDGDNGKGFRIAVGHWGHVAGEWQAFLSIKPIWAMYGK